MKQSVLLRCARRCRQAALRWLPEGDYPAPEMFLVYDNNAGSYTARGKAFYNLYSGENPRTTSVDDRVPPFTAIHRQASAR